MIPSQKMAMVWKLRNWCGGNPLAQVAEAQRLGLARVSIKVTDGKVERWESGSRTNKDLLPATVLALQSAGIEVDGWAWMKGRAVQWDWDRRRFVQCTPADEATVTRRKVHHRPLNSSIVNDHNHASRAASVQSAQTATDTLYLSRSAGRCAPAPPTAPSWSAQRREPFDPRSSYSPGTPAPQPDARRPAETSESSSSPD